VTEQGGHAAWRPGHGDTAKAHLRLPRGDGYFRRRLPHGKNEKIGGVAAIPPFGEDFE